MMFSNDHEKEAPLPTARLSVVVASHNALSTIPRCLQALEDQRSEGIAQIILVDNSTDDTAGYVRQRFPTVEVLSQPGRALIPELWGAGILRSREQVVALTTAQLVPDPGWACALLQAYAGQRWAGVGGIILPAPGLGLVDRAVYWLRYSRFATPTTTTTGSVNDIPGDNASYRREELLTFAERIQRDGFWENEVHLLLHRSGALLFATPDAIVRYQGGTPFGYFAHQRIVHGQRFGARRVAGRSMAYRLLFVAAWPLTPIVFLARIWREAHGAGGGRSLISALPVLLCLLMCWSVGELLGYLSARPGRSDGSERSERAVAATATAEA